MPYVQEHVQRYHKQEKRRAGRAVQSASRRRQVIEEARTKGPEPVRKGKYEGVLSRLLGGAHLGEAQHGGQM